MDRRAEVAQLVEQRTENPCVGGSSPPLGTTNLNVNTALEAFLLRGRFAFDPHFDHHQLFERPVPLDEYVEFRYPRTAP